MFVTYSSFHLSMLSYMNCSVRPFIRKYGNYMSALSFKFPIKQRYGYVQIKIVFTIYTLKSFSTFIILLQLTMFMLVNR